MSLFHVFFCSRSGSLAVALAAAVIDPRLADAMMPACVPTLGFCIAKARAPDPEPCAEPRGVWKSTAWWKAE